ncbi:hypothetical protein SADUNF_Sadunf10G0167800 [Salix dunnii]|uniref:RRM domain-containing protein n=1 Tax=Salix dunnii TaxID=1413687 RepID=A0A835JSR6_9ROSI|nr:hypothetical protein SADUNF_Sadunf10G0167800 [Salix dunnii]
MESSSSYVLNPMVSPEEFKIFHTIDRTLYSRLVVTLDRDPANSMQVVALWIWLEREARDNLVKRMLSLPDTLINSLADEAVLCLNCMETGRFNFSIETINDEIPLTQLLTKTGFSLRFFHDNRLGILRAITKIINEVCARAFEDILRQVMERKAVAEGSIDAENVFGQNANPLNYYGPVINPVLYYNSNAASVYGQMGISPRLTWPNVRHPGVLPGKDPYDLAFQRQILNTENIAGALNRVKISAGDQKEDQKEMQADSRTIFLTFSKGYPISEDEVRDYFTKKHGVCIEAIYMQEVSAEEQPLYARLVVPSAAILHDVLLGQSKAKFTINGKHVWARKYVRKNPKSPSPSKSPTSPQPTSPDAGPSSVNWV